MTDRRHAVSTSVVHFVNRGFLRIQSYAILPQVRRTVGVLKFALGQLNRMTLNSIYFIG